MKKATTAILLLLFSMNLYALLPLNTSPEGIITDIENISKLFPHSQGSDRENMLIEYITGRLNEKQIEYSVSDFSNALGYHSFSKIIEADIPGETEATLVLAVPLTHRSGSGETGGQGTLNITAGLQIAEALADHKPPVSIKLLFLGGEQDGEVFPLGSRLFLSTFFPHASAAVIYLDTPDRPGRLRIGTGGKGVVSPRWLIERSMNSLSGTTIDHYILGHETQIFRLGIGTSREPISLFLENDLPAIHLSGEEGRVPPESWIASLLFFINNFLENSLDGFPSDSETHYQFVQFPGETRIISEGLYIRLLLGITLLLILYPMIARRRFRRYLSMIGKHLWIIPVMVGLVFLFLLLGTFFAEAVLQLQNAPALWQDHPMAFLLLKIAGALTLYWVVHKILKKLPFSRRGNFYSATAILLLIILYLIVCAVNVSFAYIVLWSLVFAFLFSIFRQRLVKLLCLLASMAWLFYFGGIIFNTPYPEVAELLLFSRWYGNLILTLLLLPHIFMFIRLSFLFFLHGRRPRRIMDRIILTTIICSTLGLGLYLMLLPPYPAETAQPLLIRDIADSSGESRQIHLYSPAPFRVDQLQIDGRTISLASLSREESLGETGLPVFPEIETEGSTFLERKEIVVRFHGLEEKNLTRLNLKLVSRDPETGITLLDTNYPYTFQMEPSSVLIHLGTTPPLPLELSFVFPEDQKIDALYEAEFTVPDSLSRQEGKTFRIEREFLYRGVVTLTGE